MNKKEKEMQIALGTYLQTKWNEHYNLHAEAHKLYYVAVKEVYGDKVTIDWSDGSIIVNE